MVDETVSTKIERRIVPVEDGELRIVSDDGITKLTGYAAVFNKDSVNLGWFIERIAPGAFTNALKDSDVRALKNHDPNLLLGRVPKTLALEETKRGLKFEVDLPDTSTGKDVAEEVSRGDITGCSFAFTVKTEQWEETEGEPDKRTIIEVGELFDVGPVTYPAYPDTTVAARSIEAFRREREAQREADNWAEGETPAAGDTVTIEDEPEPETNAERLAKAHEQVKAFDRKQINNQIKLHL